MESARTAFKKAAGEFIFFPLTHSEIEKRQPRPTGEAAFFRFRYLFICGLIRLGFFIAANGSGLLRLTNGLLVHLRLCLL